MNEEVDSGDYRKAPKTTSVYTYDVKMKIQIFAPDELIARARLEQDGGYISSREVVLSHSTLLYDADLNELNPGDVIAAQDAEKDADSE